MTSLSSHNCHNTCPGINRLCCVRPFWVWVGKWTIKTLSSRILGQETTERGLWGLDGNTRTLAAIISFVSANFCLWCKFLSVQSFVCANQIYLRCGHTDFKRWERIFCQNAPYSHSVCFTTFHNVRQNSKILSTFYKFPKISSIFCNCSQLFITFSTILVNFSHIFTTVLFATFHISFFPPPHCFLTSCSLDCVHCSLGKITHHLLSLLKPHTFSPCPQLLANHTTLFSIIPPFST